MSFSIPDKDSAVETYQVSDVLGGGFSYNSQPFDKNFRVQGLSGQLELNIAGFFTSKFVLGFQFDFKFAKGFRQQQFSDRFKQDLSGGLYPSYSSATDSALAQSLVNAVNKNPGSETRGSYASNFGIVFSPFPVKFGGFTFIYSLGRMTFPVYTPEKIVKHSANQEWVGIDVRRVSTFEVRFYPYRFIKPKNPGSHILGRRLYLSAYYEQLKSRNVSFEGRNLTAIFQQSFADSYFTRGYFGWKIGFQIN